jgi:hypothetical protein
MGWNAGQMLSLPVELASRALRIFHLALRPILSQVDNYQMILLYFHDIVEGVACYKEAVL